MSTSADPFTRFRARFGRRPTGDEGDTGDNADLFKQASTGPTAENFPFEPSIQASANAVNTAFDSLDAETAAYVQNALDMGITQGMNPLTLANYLSFLVGPQRAEGIARNEMLGAYRDAALGIYNDNSDVVGAWMWSAAAGACVACSEEDGTIHDLDEDMDGETHYACRCSPLPLTQPWSSILGPLGIDVSDIEETSILDDYVPMSETFWQRSFEEQADILGSRSAAEAVSRGILEPSDFVGHIEGGEYEGALYTKSLREALADKGMSKAEIADLKSDLLAAVKSGDVEAATRAEAAAAELEHGMTGVLEVRGPPQPLTAKMEGEIAKLQTKRDTLAAQRDTAQARLDTLSDQWVKLVLQTGEFDPVDDAEELAALEEKIAAVEAQQATQLARLDKLDQQLAVVDSKIAEANMPGAERVQLLRRQADESMVTREALYAQQHDLLEEQAKLENQERNPAGAIGAAQRRALIDLYRGTLDQDAPEVKAYFKAVAAHDKAQADIDAAKAEQDRLERVMDRLAVQGKKGGEEYAQAKADQDAAVKAYEKAYKASTRTWGQIWDAGRSVYVPETDSIAGFNYRLQRMGLHFTPEQIANSPRVLAERQRIAGLATRIEDVKAQVRGLEKPIKDLNKEIERQLAQLRELHATLSTGADALDTLRPFSDVLALPEGHQPPNALMNQLDYRMHEPRAVTKSRIIDDISTRLKDNPAWREYVDRMPAPNRLGVYHQYVHVMADERDTKSAKLVADLVRKWGVGYRPGSPEWIAMQTAVKEEFGLDAAIHSVLTAAQERAGEAFYAENGAALRSFMRAMYDNTQAWFADHGITEIEVYRGFHWSEGDPALMKDINWGPLDNQNHGIKELHFNPFQSFSADINISQGTASHFPGAFGGGFAGSGDYRLLVGARIPVDRVLATAQSGFGAKLESEIVVMGRATDTVAYRAGTRVEADLLRQADEQALAGDARQMVYALEDGTRLSVAANADGTFTLTYQDGPQGKIGALKLGSSKTYKTEKGINSALKSMRIANTYVAPAPEELAIREGEEGAAAARAVSSGLAARVDNIPADASVADMQDYIQAQLPNLHRVDLMDLDAQTARLVGNATVNLIQQLPDVADHLELLLAGPRPTDALAYVSNDGLSLVINSPKWLDLAEIAANAPQWYADGWWVSQTPEDILGHEIGHLVQVHYHISDTTWLETMERVTAGGGNPIVSTYGVHNIKEAFAETFALLIYGDPTPAQLPIAREMADLLRDEGLNYNTLRAAVGMSPLSLGASA